MSSTLRHRALRLASTLPDESPVRAGLIKILADETSPVDEPGPSPLDLKSRIEKFQGLVQETVTEYCVKQFPNVAVPTITLEWGPRYVRIVKNDSAHSRSAFGFVDLTNGDLLKADGWKKPAKGARGSIYDVSTWKNSHSPMGMNYRYR